MKLIPGHQLRMLYFPGWLPTKQYSRKKNTPSCNVTKKQNWVLTEQYLHGLSHLQKVSRALYVSPLVLMRKRIYLKTPCRRSCSSSPESQINHRVFSLSTLFPSSVSASLYLAVAAPVHSPGFLSSAPFPLFLLFPSLTLLLSKPFKLLWDCVKLAPGCCGW